MAFIVQLHEGVAIGKFLLDKPKLSIGRSPDSDIFIDDVVVSTEHAIIEKVVNDDAQGLCDYYIEDLKSTNSTFVNGEKITRRKLNHNDIVRVGWSSFKFVDETQSGSERTAKIHKSWIPGVYYTKD